MKTILTRPHLLLISIIGVIVPSRLRADWREEWESELRYREALLADWDRLTWYHKWDLLKRSAGVSGSTVRLDGHTFTIVGVVDEAFTGIRIGTPRDVWVPMTALRRLDPKTGARLDQRHASWLELFGRLKPDVTLEQARTQFTLIAARLERAYPATNAHAGVRLEAGLGHDVDTEKELRRFARLPFAAVGIVLLIACANVAGLLLTRGSARRREIATRLAMGAGRIRLVRQLLTESMTLAFAGGLSGLAVAVWLTAWLRSLLPNRFLFVSFDVDLGLDWRVLAFTLTIAAATGLVFGLAPALQVSRPDLVVALKGSRGSTHRRLSLGSILVVSEVALSLTLLVAAGLCVRTLKNVEAIDVGYEPSQVLTARLDLARQGYTDDRGRTFQQQLLGRIESSAGVEAAGFGVTLPLNDSRWETSVRREGDPTRYQTFQNVISPAYFKAMSIPMVMGRSFSSHDDDRSEPVVILNQTLARLMWPDESPLGKRLTFKGRAMEVVGVVRDIKGRSLVESAGPMFYLPLSQDYHPAMVLHVRTSLPPEQFVTTLRREVAFLDSDLPVYAIKPLAEHVTATLTPERLLAHVTSAFGLLALVLAAIGLYGLLSHSVTERTAEIGVRMAIGARKVDVVRLFVARGMMLAVWGVALGLGAAAVLMPLIKSALFGVSALDPIGLTMAAAALILVALMACFIPARRAANADPKSALRYE